MFYAISEHSITDHRAYRFQFEVVSRRLVEGHSFEEVGANLHRDGGQLTLNGLGDGLHPASLLGLCLTAAALHSRQRETGADTGCRLETGFCPYHSHYNPRLYHS